MNERRGNIRREEGESEKDQLPRDEAKPNAEQSDVEEKGDKMSEREALEVEKQEFSQRKDILLQSYQQARELLTGGEMSKLTKRLERQQEAQEGSAKAGAREAGEVRFAEIAREASGIIEKAEQEFHSGRTQSNLRNASEELRPEIDRLVDEIQEFENQVNTLRREFVDLTAGVLPEDKIGEQRDRYNILSKDFKYFPGVTNDWQRDLIKPRKSNGGRSGGFTHTQPEHRGW